MKYILRIFIVLMITLTTSSCFDNLYNLQIQGAILPSDKDCSYQYEIDGTNARFLEDGTMMDLAYTKLAGAYTHNYKYLLGLGLINVLDADMKSRGEVSGYANSIETKSIVVKTYTDQNVLVDSDVITKNVIIDPKSGGVVLVPLFRNILKWEGETGDNSRGFLYSSFYDNEGGNGLLTKYVTVDIVINAETLAGEYATSNHFKFRINLCVDCLLCPDKNVTNDSVCNAPTSLVDSCQQRGVLQPTVFYSYCGLHQDTPPLCVQQEAE